MANVDDSRALNAGAGLTGGGDLTADRTFNVAATDGSIAVSADGIAVGVLQSDAQHGDLGGGDLHALATTGVAGFMAGGDKAALDLIRGNLLDAEVALGNSNTTLTVGGGRRYRLPTSTLTADHTATLSVTGAAAGDTITIVRDDGSYNHYRIMLSSTVQIWDMAGPGAFVAEFDGTAWIPRTREQVPGERILNVRHFGAFGDGTAQDTEAIQAAIDAALSDGSVVHIPPGTYRITATLRIQDGGSNAKHGIRIFGHVQAGAGDVNTVLLWDNPENTSPMIAMYTRESVLQGFSMKVAAGSHTACAVDIDKSLLSGANIGTEITMREVQIWAAVGAETGGTMTDGIRIGYYDDPPANNLEFNQFHNCLIRGVQNACLLIKSPTAQSKSNVIYHCAFQYSRYGIFMVSGSYQCRDSSFTGIYDTCIHHENVTEPILIDHPNEEASNRFLLSAGPSTTVVEVIGGRFDLNAMGQSLQANPDYAGPEDPIFIDAGYGYSDGSFIRVATRGVLALRNNLFTLGEPTTMDAMRVFRGTNPLAGVLISEGNVYPNMSPFAVFDGAYALRLYSIGDLGYDSGSEEYKILGDQFGVCYGARHPGDVVLTTGTNPASSGSIRHSNEDEQNWNSALTPGNLVKGMSVTASDVLVLGDDTNAVGHEVLAKTGGTWKWKVNSAEIARLNATQLLFANSVSSPAVTQSSTSSATGTPLTIAAQDAATTGGALRLKSGGGGTNPGSVEIYNGSTLLGNFVASNSYCNWVTGTAAAVSAGTAIIANANGQSVLLQALGTGGNIIAQAASSVILSGGVMAFRDQSGVEAVRIVPVPSGASTMTVAASVDSWTMIQSSTAVSSATGKTMFIRAQASTGTGGIGGDVSIHGGYGTSTYGGVVLNAYNTPRIKIDGTGIGFFGVTPVARPAAYTQTYSTADRTLSAYSPDAESSAYTGLDNTAAGTPYAQLADLNALRTAYENLRAFTEDLAQLVNAMLDDDQAIGLKQ